MTIKIPLFNMKLQLPQNGYVVVPDNFRATITTFNGSKVAVINDTHFVHFTEWAYDQFCKDASYCDYVDMLPEEIRMTSIHNNESLLAYCYYYKSEWTDIKQQISIHETQIEKLKAL